MINGFPIVDRFKDQLEFEELVKRAKDDNHGVFAPTHPIRKNGELLGYFSITPNVPIVFAWLSTKELTARESIGLINTVENFCYLQGAPAICFPLPKDSPFHLLAESHGFENGGEYTFFMKKL